MKYLFIGGPLDGEVIDLHPDRASWTHEDDEGNASYYGRVDLSGVETFFKLRNMDVGEAMNRATTVHKSPPEEPPSEGDTPQTKPKK